MHMGIMSARILKRSFFSLKLFTDDFSRLDFEEQCFVNIDQNNVVSF